MIWFHNFFAFFHIVFLSFFLTKNESKNLENINIQAKNLGKLSQLFQEKNKQKAQFWADSVYNALNTKQRIGQFFIARAYANTTETKPEKIQELEDLIKNYHIGGLCFFQGTPHKQFQLTQKYQKIAKTPLWISIDAEWGLGMRLDSTISFPRAMTLGAITENPDSLIYEMGREIGKHCREMGIHINFAPVVDVNNNPKNPVIDRRSFGENPQKVAQLAHNYAKGLQDEGILAVVKHFPGHGDTETDSHLSLPKISHQKQRLDSVELYPFQQLIRTGIEAVMAGHLHVSALDTIPASISKKILDEILRKQMNFKGLIFSDALEMQGIANHYPSNKFSAGELELRALQAGIDVLLIANDIPKAIARIEKAFLNNEIKDFEQRVKKILIAKFHLIKKEKSETNKIDHNKIVSLTKKLNSPQAKILQKTLFHKAITILGNDDNFLPLRNLDTLRLASVAMGAKEKTFFQQHLDNYAPVTHFFVPKITTNPINNTQNTPIENPYNQILEKIKTENFNTIIVSLHDLSKSKPNFNVTSDEYSFLRMLCGLNKKVVICGFFTPYALSVIEKSCISPNIVWAYEENEITSLLIPQIIFGALPASGKLPISIGHFKAGMGQKTASLGRMTYPIAEEVGLHTDSLARIDGMIKQALANKEFPGCQMLIVKKNAVVWQKSYGTYTFPNTKDLGKSTQNNNLYDVASISKVLGTLLAIMYLHDQKKINLEEKISHYLPEMSKTNKGNITIKNLLMHQAGLIPYMKLYERTLDNYCKPNTFFYQKTKNEKFPLQVAEQMFARKDLPDLMWKWYMDSPVKPIEKDKIRHKHEYSDLSFYILQRLAEKLLNEKIDIFLEKTFYKPLGLAFTTYNPLTKFPKTQIIPTEKDTLFRHQFLQGYVHDQGASMMGGIAGHAGLFSNAQNLGVLLQMLLNGGEYGNRKYLSRETISLFTAQQYDDNRRGLGWDKPDKVDISYIANIMSVQSFGHSGFTGCVVWADPTQDLAVVFLSNRICPKVENDKLIKNHTRRKAFNLIK